MSIQSISFLNDPNIINTISKGFNQLYNSKPQFPITYLAHWLYEHQNIKRKQQAYLRNKPNKIKIFQTQQQTIAQQLRIIHQENSKLIANHSNNALQFTQTISACQFMEDLLLQWLPQTIEHQFKLTGCYVGLLTFPKKTLQQHNFQPGAQLDIQSPKIIEYIGASISHKNLMVGAVLPAQSGKTYEAFIQAQQQPQENEEGQQAKPKDKKKNYLLVSNILKEEKMFYFKFPRLGSYACFPFRVNNHLLISTLDKGLEDYKTYLNQCDEAEKEYQEKLVEARNEAEEALKKYQEFEADLQDPNSVAQKDALGEQSTKKQQQLATLQKEPPKIEEVVFETSQLIYVLGCDTLGQDRVIEEKDLESINAKIEEFSSQWEKKQRIMLLHDIKIMIEEEGSQEALENAYQDHERNASAAAEQVREQFPDHQKTAEFEYSLTRCNKLITILSEQQFQHSMEIYLSYYVPKYTQIIQIGLMLLGYQKQMINTSKSNKLNHRQMLRQQRIQKMIQQLSGYALRRDESKEVPAEYKITKLLERINKIDLEILAKYNGWLYALADIIKAYCETRMLGHQAKVEVHQAKLKEHQARETEIATHGEEMAKSLQNHKADLTQQEAQKFNEEEWTKNYLTDNPIPESLELPILAEFLDLE